MIELIQITFFLLWDLEDQIDEDSPLHHPTMKQNGTAGVRFSDNQSSSHNISLIPDLNYCSAINSKITNDIRMDARIHIPSKARTMSIKSNATEAQVGGIFQKNRIDRFNIAMK